MKKILATVAILFALAGGAYAQVEEERHFVLEGNDALMPLGVSNRDTLELVNYNGDWSRFSNLETFIVGPDSHIDFTNIRERRNVIVNNTRRFVNNGSISLLGEAVRMGHLAGAAGEPGRAILDIRGGALTFERTIYEGNGNFIFPVIEAMNQDGSPAGVNAVAAKLIFEGGVLAAPIFITLNQIEGERPLAASELVLMRGVKLENALNTDLAVVLQNQIVGGTRVHLVVDEQSGGDVPAYIWRVEPVN